MSEIVEAGVTEAATRAVSVSDAAAARLVDLLAAKGDGDTMLRITVNGGGCSGFTYSFDFDAAVNDDDHVFAGPQVKVVVDEASLELIGGSQVDWVETLGGAAFQLVNPNATASCGCGASFSV